LGAANGNRRPGGARRRTSGAIYSAEQRRRRDESTWTLVQGILAPLQFLVFLVSLALMLRYLLTGNGLEAAELSILVKTSVLLTIMVTGSCWERAVFGRWLFVPAFFWEDVVSMFVIALHLAYVALLVTDTGTPLQQLLVALIAYGAYVVNAGQFLWKFRLARLDTLPDPVLAAGGRG
jgi:3-vinyl bacteriochlorophyllide hydratase